MKNALKVLIFVLVVLIAGGGAVAYLLNYGGPEFEYADAAREDSVEITAYNGKNTDVVIPKKIKGKTVVSVGEKAFSHSEITSVEIPDTVTAIEDKAFYQCPNLSTVDLGEGVETIGESAFFECKSLKSVKIPASLKALEGAVFYGCPDIAFEISEGSTFDYEDGILYGNDKSVVYTVSAEKDLSSFTFPATVREFAPYSLACHNEIVNFTVPSGVTHLPDCMLIACKNLETVMIPDSVKSIGSTVFMGCMKLKSITVPASVGEIGKGNFPVNKSGDMPDFTLKVYENSSAFFYAQENGVNFEIIK